MSRVMIMILPGPWPGILYLVPGQNAILVTAAALYVNSGLIKLFDPIKRNKVPSNV